MPDAQRPRRADHASRRSSSAAAAPLSTSTPSAARCAHPHRAHATVVVFRGRRSPKRSRRFVAPLGVVPLRIDSGDTNRSRDRDQAVAATAPLRPGANESLSTVTPSLRRSRRVERARTRRHVAVPDQSIECVATQAALVTDRRGRPFVWVDVETPYPQARPWRGASAGRGALTRLRADSWTCASRGAGRA